MSRKLSVSVWASSLSWQPMRELARAIQLAEVDFTWAHTPNDATVWLLDARCGAVDPELAAQYSRLLHRPRVASLGNDAAAVPQHPEWTPFMPPIDAKRVRRWLELAPKVAEAPWRQGLLRLQQWPNLARYGVHGRDSRLVSACMTLLRAPTDYRTLLDGGVPSAGLDQLLADAFESGLLEVGGASTIQDHAAAQQQSSVAGEPSRARLFEHIAARSAAQ